MAITLRENPIIKITLMCEEDMNELYPGYVLDDFKLTKRLLEPNKLEFTLRRDNLSIDLNDYDFELKDDLLAAKVEMSIKARRYDFDKEEWVDYDVDNFFYGYVQNIKVVRESISAPYRLKCTAFSPDSRLKGHPGCDVWYDTDLTNILEDVFGINGTEGSPSYNRISGEYGNEVEGLDMDVNPYSCGDGVPLPYTVRYNESAYDFVKRMAKRYGEYFYYEDRKVRFGSLEDVEGLDHFITMNLGYDLESYTYELNMNDHSGIVYTEHHPNVNKAFGVGYEKADYGNDRDEVFKSVVWDDEYENDMATSSFDWAQNYFGNLDNTVYEPGMTQLYDTGDEPEFSVLANHNFLNDEVSALMIASERRHRLDEYIVSDGLRCYGKSMRCDLKLGTHIIIFEMTRSEKGDELEDGIEHKELSVYDLTYAWPARNEKNEIVQLAMDNEFKALPTGDAVAPPYLERDKDGFLIYGDFDIYPKCGPQYGTVVDNEDPDHMGRVQVSLLWQEMMGRCKNGPGYDPKKADDKFRTPWIWVSSPYQGGSHGAHLIPEIGDQVLVGFVANNAERPYVIGSRLSKDDYVSKYLLKDKNSKNSVKGIRSRRGQTIEIVDEGDVGYVRIYDAMEGKYDLVFDSDNRLIRLETTGNIELVAGGNITMKANGNIKMEAKKDIDSTAKNDWNAYAEHEMECHAKGGAWFDSDEGDLHLYGKKKTNVQGNDGKAGLLLASDKATMGFGVGSDGKINESDVAIILDKKGATLKSKKNEKVVIDSQNGGMEIKAKTEINIEANTLKSNTKGETRMKGNQGHYD